MTPKIVVVGSFNAYLTSVVQWMPVLGASESMPTREAVDVFLRT